MARHHPDLIFCRKQPGIGKPPSSLPSPPPHPSTQSSLIYSSVTFKTFPFPTNKYIYESKLVRICDECNYGSYQGRCIVCGGKGVSDAYYCAECVVQEKDRDGCPKIVNLGQSRTDLFYERKKFGASFIT
ncbi:PHD finger-like domain-containing protein 5A [Smittium mucronatum]|uniref:PHD finger-like domain-containing protein 5A n=1 Tax=Smittium mucronatum TaxID=133383 RepID=A0A1R0GMG6_9FUNG|nr:PHD finger-like domain-containing protein 5A [Smittium mucronatum]